MADFTDFFTSYLSNRLDNATQPFTDPGTYMQNRLYGDVGMAPPGETEEERRKRLEREARDRANKEIESTTVKQYADGSKEEVVKTQIPPEAPAVPVAPQSMVQAPPVAQPPAPVQQPQPVVQAAPQPVPALPVAPTVEPQPAPQPQGRPIWSDIQGQEVPLQPAMPTQPVAAPAPQVAPTPAPAPAPAATPAPAPQPTTWDQRLSTAKSAGDYESLLTDPNTPQDVRRYAATQYSTSLSKENDQARAEKDVAAMKETDLAKALTTRSKEGSYIKAYVFARLGLNKLADEEQQKLGSGTKFESLMGPNGQRYTAEISGDGSINRAFDTTGRSVDNDTLATLSANALATKGIGQAGATRIRDSQGNEFSVVPTTRGSVFYDNAGRLATPVGATVPITTGSDVALEYNKRFYGAQGGAQGKAAGEGFTPGGTVTAPGMPSGQVTSTGYTPSFSNPSIRVISGDRTTQQQTAIWDESVAAGRPGRTAQGYPIAPPGTSPHEVGGGNALDIDSKTLNKEGRRELTQKGYYQPNPSASPNHWELAVTTSSGATIPNANAPAVSTGAGGPAQQRQALEVGGKRTESFNKIIDTEYRENGQKGEIISNNRKQQFDILNRVDPTTNKGIAETISGLYTAANENPNNKKLTIFRDIMLGKVVPEKEISERAAELNLSSTALSALQQYNSLNAQIAGQTLRETAGPGAVSDAEQAANRARNVDITKAPMLGAYNMMSQSQFSGDLQRYKADLSANTTAPNATAFDRDFRRTQAELIKAYRDTTDARLNFIDKNGGATNPAAIREGYKRFPVPQYDAASGQWQYLKPLEKIFK